MPKSFQQKHLLLTLITLFLISAVFIYIIFSQIETHHNKYKKQHDNLLVQEAISLFESMIKIRQWNASYGGVYVKKRDGLSPNPYLKENTLKTDDNKTLIKINPAWMTRQISDILNEDMKRYYKITSLNPLNPNNFPDKFETKALNYFNENMDRKYFYNFESIEPFVEDVLEDNVSKSKQMFNFMGRLDTKEACLNCHAKQGYKIGDLRGGIRISIPLNGYIASLNAEQKRYELSKSLIILSIIVLIILILSVIYLFFREQNRLERFNDILENKVNRRTSELNELNESLEQRIEEEVLKSHEKDQILIAQSKHAAMGEMIAMIAHQWRQPISIISMDASNMMIDIELDDIDKKIFREYLEGINDQTEHLSSTIDDFRNFFRKEKDKEEVLISKVIGECFQIIGDSLKAHGIEYEVICESEKEAKIYSRELLQVLLNIVNNAKDILIEQETQGGKISVKLDQKDDEVSISICNNGVAIPEDILPRIFEPYFSTKTQKDGTGLGLYMSKMIIQMHFSGKITVTQKEKQTCFSIVFTN